MPAVPYRDPNNYVKIFRPSAPTLNASRPAGALWANQFDNVANREVHLDDDGQEIWRQTDGRVDGFVCAVGSGGTLGGVSRGLKEAGRRYHHRAWPIRRAPRSTPTTRPAS